MSGKAAIAVRPNDNIMYRGIVWKIVSNNTLTRVFVLQDEHGHRVKLKYPLGHEFTDMGKYYK